MNIYRSLKCLVSFNRYVIFLKRTKLKKAKKAAYLRIITAINSQDESAKTNVFKALSCDFGPKHKFRTGIPECVLSNLSNVFVSKANNILTIEDFDELILMISNLDNKILNPEKWLTLFYIATRLGLIHLGFVFRYHAVSQTYSKYNSEKSPFVSSYLAASIDLGNINEIYFNRNYSKMCYQMFNRKTKTLLSILSRNSTRFFDNQSKKQTQCEREFESLINNRTIAIVGPAYSEEKSGQEIDSYDLVIRVNYKGKQVKLEEEIYGSRTDISYYNKVNINYIMNGTLPIEVIDDLKYAVFKSSNIKGFRKIIHSHKNVRFMKSFDNLLYSGMLNMIQNVLLDVLSYSPQKVKLYKVNFYLSKKFYSSNYDPNISSSNHYYGNWLSYAEHDLATQFNVSKLLWVNNLIEIDSECKAVLKLQTKDYMKGIDDLYRLNLV